ncbi:MAG: response regulator [Clostridium butyricum]|jgi:two-component system response regulator YesN|nr:response regulator [Clostridium butyricum]
MNVLIVDDDRFVVFSLLKKIDWTSLGIKNVYTANNVSQSKKIIMKESIQILISDIDMPQGSGLDLLSWIRYENKEIQTIFLTNYADFNYAKKAIELQSLEYYLKPIEFQKLTIIIKKAIKKVNETKNKTYLTNIANLYEINKVKLCEHFWRTYLKGELDSSITSLQLYFDKNHLPYNSSDIFLILLFDLYPYTLSNDYKNISYFDDITKQTKNLKSAFYANFADIVSPYDIMLESITIGNQSISIIRCNDMDSHKHIYSRLVACAEKLIVTMQDQYSCPISCYIGLPTTLADFNKTLNDLQAMSIDIVNCRNQVFTYKTYNPIFEEYKPPNLDFLYSQLQIGNRQTFIQTCYEYIFALMNKFKLNHSILNSFEIDITQLIYSFLKEKGILAHRLLAGKTYELLLKNSSKSVEDMYMYVKFTVNLALNYVEFSTSQKSIANIICDYVNTHYSEDINRDTIAEVVRLNSDYTARLFKKEMGTSLVNYIIQKRISVAKHLLQNTNFPVNSVSDKVGYGNYSYFTKLFKKETSFTPIDYRKKYSQI